MGSWISFDTLDLIQNYLIESVHDWTRDIPIIEDLINPLFSGIRSIAKWITNDDLVVSQNQSELFLDFCEPTEFWIRPIIYTLHNDINSLNVNQLPPGHLLPDIRNCRRFCPSDRGDLFYSIGHVVLPPIQKIFRLENGALFPKSVTPRRQVGTQTIDCFMSWDSLIKLLTTWWRHKDFKS